MTRSLCILTLACATGASACQPIDDSALAYYEHGLIKCTGEGTMFCNHTLPPIEDWDGTPLPPPKTNRAIIVIKPLLAKDRLKIQEDAVQALIIDEKIERTLRVPRGKLLSFLDSSGGFEKLIPDKRKTLDAGGRPGLTACDDDLGPCDASANPAACYLELAEAFSTLEEVAASTVSSCGP